MMNAETLKVCNQKFPLKWFSFRQNNSGGSFEVNENLDILVIIQARTPSEANNLAEKIGIYFDGCASGYDCGCCGDRWTPRWDFDEGTDFPERCGEVIENYSLTEKTVLNEGKWGFKSPIGTKIYPYGTIE